MNVTIPAIPTIITVQPSVPNQFPIDPTPQAYRLAIIGEAPGENEEEHGVPFVGASGNRLNGLLRDYGMSRYNVFVGNVSQRRPFGNDFNRFQWSADHIQSGIVQLDQDLRAFKPLCILALGNAAFHYLRHSNVAPPFLRGKHAWPSKITSYRGSRYWSQVYDCKYIGSIHPAACLHEESWTPLLRNDIEAAGTEARSRELVLPTRELVTSLDANQLVHLMDTWPAGVPCSVDMEGGLPNCKVNDGVRADSKKRRHIGWKCVSLSPNPTIGYVIPWWKFDEYSKERLLRSFARLMARADVPKTLQNSLYELFVLMFGYGITIRGPIQDTMLSGWEIYCELPKGLSTQASIWTREPHWKDDEMYDTTGENLALGCAKDTAVTAELTLAHHAYFADPHGALPFALRQRALAHYTTNLQMIKPLHYMEQRGILYDQENVKTKLKEVKQELQEVAGRLNKTCGKELRGEGGSLGAQRLANALYLDGVAGFRYPPQFKKEGGKKTEKLTTDIEALLSLRKKHPGDAFLDGVLRHRHLEGLLETLSIVPDADGRVRCGYNVVGTETGRVSCYTSPTGAGANLTTITKKLRGNYIADPGHDFCQCDLEGADGWTVAAHCDRLGDPRMLDDYNAKIKPAKIIAFLYYLGERINHLDRRSLKFWQDKGFAHILADVGKWLYLGCKRVQHGTNYLMGIPTMILNVIKDSFKESGEAVYMEHSVATTLQGLYRSRYPGIAMWHNWAQAQLMHHGYLTSASGHTRIFFGRRHGRDIEDTVKEFLADEPQANTTWATNLAMLKLWNDPANRVVRRDDPLFWTGDGTCRTIPEADLPFMFRIIPGALLIEPLHQVHDALCTQWPKFVRAWARTRMSYYFGNALEIANRRIVIPFDGTYGPSWGDMPEGI